MLTVQISVPPSWLCSCWYCFWRRTMQQFVMVLCVFVGEYGLLHCTVQKMNGPVTKSFRSAVSCTCQHCQMSHSPCCHLSRLYRSTSGAVVSFMTVSGGWYTCSDERLEQSAAIRMVTELLLFDAEVTLSNQV